MSLVLEKEMATHSSVLAWRTPGMWEPGGLPSMGSHRVGHDRSDLAAAAASNGHRTGKGQFSFQSQRKAMLKIAQTTASYGKITCIPSSKGDTILLVVLVC